MAFSLDMLNNRFVELIKTAEDRAALIEATDLFLRQKIREDSFFRQILTPRIITPAECDRSVTHRGLSKIIDIEPDSTAYAIDFRGDTPVHYLHADRYEVKFYTIESEEFQIKEQELLSYEAPITEIIRKNSEYDIAKVEDTKFMAAVNAAITSTGKDVAAAGSSFVKKDFANAFKLLDGNELKAAIVLINGEVYDDINAWDNSELGDTLLGEVTVNGYSHQTLMGRKLVVTNKGSIVPSNKLFVFTDQQYLGHAFVLSEEIKFDLFTEFDLIRFKAWETMAAGIGNANAVASCTISG